MSLSVTPKLDAFVKFCSEQDPVRKIDHTNGWNACAVGEFTPGYNAQFPDQTVFGPFWLSLALRDEIEDVSPDLADQFIDILGDGDTCDEIQTFGGMTDWLHQIQHQIHEAAQ